MPLSRVLPFLIFAVLLFFLFSLFALAPSPEVSSTSSEDFYEYTLIAPNEGGNGVGGKNEILLIDAEGATVHTWTLPEKETQFAKLKSDGTLVVLLGAAARPTVQGNKGDSARLIEMDWEGNVVWEYKNPLLHHDFALLPNGNIAAIVRESLEDSSTWIDRIIEIDHDTQEIVWEWSEKEGFDLSQFSLQGSDELFHTNALSFLPENNIFSSHACYLLSSREQDMIFVVDREMRKVVWEMRGDPLEKQHNPSLLSNGNILVFNNRPLEQASQILEISPFTEEIVWKYEANGFFAPKISGAQRLPNGNTLITEGTTGTVFEVTPAGKTIWTYIAYRSGTTNPISLFRAERYSNTDISFPPDLNEP